MVNALLLVVEIKSYRWQHFLPTRVKELFRRNSRMMPIEYQQERQDAMTNSQLTDLNIDRFKSFINWYGEHDNKCTIILKYNTLLKRFSNLPLYSNCSSGLYFDFHALWNAVLLFIGMSCKVCSYILLNVRNGNQNRSICLFTLSKINFLTQSEKSVWLLFYIRHR